LFELGGQLLKWLALSDGGCQGWRLIGGNAAAHFVSITGRNIISQDFGFHPGPERTGAEGVACLPGGLAEELPRSKVKPCLREKISF
jgi:hypothetical protein